MPLLKAYTGWLLKQLGSSPPTPPAGSVALYAKSDGLHVTTPDGVDTLLGAPGSGGVTSPGAITGEIKMWPTATPPADYLLCNGGTFDSTQYPNLANLLGDTFGIHSGTTYYLPNFQGKTPRGETPGSSGGSDTTTLGANNLPKHTHDINHNHPAFNTAAGGNHRHLLGMSNGTGVSAFNAAQGTGTQAGAWINPVSPGGGDTNSDHVHNIDVPALGATASGDGGFVNDPVNVTNPYLGVNFIIKT